MVNDLKENIDKGNFQERSQELADVQELENIFSKFPISNEDTLIAAIEDLTNNSLFYEKTVSSLYIGII